jgi:hypothetical protein
MLWCLAPVPRTMTVRLTNAALNCPTGSAAVPRATTIIGIVIVVTPVVVPIANANVYAGCVEVDTLCLNRSSRPKCRCADKA